MKSKGKLKHRIISLVVVLLFVLLTPIWLPVVILTLAYRVLLFISLHLLVWLIWLPRGKRLLLVYPNSPLWQSHIESRILPPLREQAVVLNWSERQKWRKRRSLAVALLRFFGGPREFNPLVVVFRPPRFAKVFRFFRPFHDLKHGKPESLAALEHDLFEYLRLPDARLSA